MSAAQAATCAPSTPPVATRRAAESARARAAATASRAANSASRAPGCVSLCAARSRVTSRRALSKRRETSGGTNTPSEGSVAALVFAFVVVVVRYSFPFSTSRGRGRGRGRGSFVSGSSARVSASPSDEEPSRSPPSPPSSFTGRAKSACLDRLGAAAFFSAASSSAASASTSASATATPSGAMSSSPSPRPCSQSSRGTVHRPAGTSASPRSVWHSPTRDATAAAANDASAATSTVASATSAPAAAKRTSGDASPSKRTAFRLAATSESRSVRRAASHAALARSFRNIFVSVPVSFF